MFVGYKYPIYEFCVLGSGFVFRRPFIFYVKREIKKSSCRHSRAGGNPSVNFGCLIDFLFSYCLVVDSRLRGNDGNSVVQVFRRLFKVGRILESDKISVVSVVSVSVSKRRIQESVPHFSDDPSTLRTRTPAQRPLHHVQRKQNHKRNQQHKQRHRRRALYVELFQLAGNNQRQDFGNHRNVARDKNH